MPRMIDPNVFRWERLFFLTEMTLSPIIATLIFAAGCVMGYQYRRVWKQEGPRWQLWLYGTGAAVALLTVAFVPLVGRG